MKKLLFGLALLVTTPAMAEKKAPEPEPATHPDWSAARAEGERQMREGLYDPEGARISWKRGFTWTSWKQGSGGILNKRRWGWLACGSINGKNMLGGYTGENAAIIIVTPDGQITGAINGQAPGWLNTIDSDCSRFDQATGPLVPELRGSGTQVAATSVGLADELSKLAELRDKGILSAAEFDAQKARLLAR